MNFDQIALSSADPESFVRGGPALTFFFFLVYEGRDDQNTTKVDHHRASETLFKWRFAGVPMMAQH